jgi:signal peptide peptidase SppA
MTRVFETPLLIEREKGRVIADLVLGRTDGARLQVDDGDPAGTPRPLPRRPYVLDEGIAIVPVHGTLVQRAHGLDALSGLTSYERIQGLMQVARRDPAVRGILLDIGSPGGEAHGCFEFAEWIFGFRGGDKPVWAVATGQATSAAYLLGRAAERFVVGAGTMTGSIGVLWIHVDQSQAETALGLVVTELYAGEFKVDGSPHRPLDEGARARIQALVGRHYDLFVERVAAYTPRVTESAVRDTQAALYFGADAVTAGLVDGVMRLDQAVGAFKAVFNPRRISIGV